MPTLPGRTTLRSTPPRPPTSTWNRLALVFTMAVLGAGCASRPRPTGDALAPTAAGRLDGSFDTFLTARAGDELHVLALSGGGQNGAFGAGVLKGWRSAGRPRFDVVTGISTGALQASHAFLDTPADDDAIGRAYTESSSRDILCPRSPIAVVFGASVNDFSPLRRFLDRLFDDATIDRVAAASEGGRRLLLVGTTNLDSGKLAVWDLGALARARHYRRYRDVIFASASPPLLAEPVFLDGNMHTDGSVISQVFVPNPEERLSAARLAAYKALAEQRSPGKGTRLTVDVIVNGLLGNRAKRVPHGAIPIGGRTVDIGLTSAENGSLWYVHGLAARRHAAFHVIAIPETSRAEAEDAFAFDAASMRALLAVGVELGRHPENWMTEPPAIGED